jgi:hypothetical protein
MVIIRKEWRKSQIDPATFYQKLVDRYGVARYIKPWSLMKNDELIDKILSEAGISIDQSTRDRLIKEYIPQKMDAIFKHLAQPILNATPRILNNLPEEHRRDLTEKVFIGEFPTGEFNACASKVPDEDGYLFLLNVGFTDLIYTITKIVFSQSKWANINNKGEIVKSTIHGNTEMSYKEAGSYLRNTIKQYVSLNEWVPTIGKKRIILKGESRNMMTSMLVFATMSFALAHEIAHAILGHLDREETFLLSVPNIGIDIEVIKKHHQDEIEADLLGGALIIHAQQELVNENDRFTDLKNRIRIAGPFFFFEVARLIEKVAQNIDYTTHPPAKQRSDILQVAFRRVLPQQAFSESKTIVGLLQAFERQFL